MLLNILQQVLVLKQYVQLRDQQKEILGHPNKYK